MCDCKWFDGDMCQYPDYANGQTEDNYCKVEEGDMEEDDCDEFDDSETYEENEDK